MEATTVDNITLCVEFDAEATRKSENVNSSMLRIELTHCTLQAHMQYMDERLGSLRWAYYSRTRTEEERTRRLQDIKRFLSEFNAWHKAARHEVFASEYTSNYRPGQKLLRGYRAENAKQCERLFRGTAHVVHQLQQPHPYIWDNMMRAFPALRPKQLPPVDPEGQRILAEYAVYLAAAMGWSLGPIGDMRYRHPDKPKWARIKARSMEHLRILVQKDITDGVGGAEGVERNKNLAADLKRAALAARKLADQGDAEKLVFAAESVEYERAVAESRKRLSAA